MDPAAIPNGSVGQRTVVITGGNTGLGYACATALLRSTAVPGWHVILACRDERRAAAAVMQQIAAGSANTGHVEAMALDLASLASIRTFAAEITDRVTGGEIPPLHAVVCNAGVNPVASQSTTADGFESTFGVNHLGHFALVNQLLPVLQPPGRVAVVASGVHDPAQKTGVAAPSWNDPAALAIGDLGPAAASDKPFTYGQRRYSTSKLANIYFTHALARRLPEGVTANAFDPGLMPATGLMREAPTPVRLLAKHVLPHIIPLLRLYSHNVHTVQESGNALARLASDPDLAATTGRYFEGLREIRSSEDSYNDKRAEELWNTSRTLTRQ